MDVTWSESLAAKPSAGTLAAQADCKPPKYIALSMGEALLLSEKQADNSRPGTGLRLASFATPAVLANELRRGKGCHFI